VEQKSRSVVRRLVGYDRYRSKAVLEQLNHLYRLVRLYVNFFQPTMKLKHKTRHGAKIHKVYDTARTPYQRLLESGILGSHQEQTLARLYYSLDSVQLLTRINPNSGATMGPCGIHRSHQSKGGFGNPNCEAINPSSVTLSIDATRLPGIPQATDSNRP